MELRRIRRRPQINIVPLVDVLIVLIFFLLLTMQFRQTRVLDITPPQIESAGQGQAAPSLILSVLPDGRYFLQGQEVGQEGIDALFAEQAEKTPVPELLISADESVPLKYVTHAIDRARLAGLQRVRLHAR